MFAGQGVGRTVHGKTNLLPAPFVCIPAKLGSPPYYPPTLLLCFLLAIPGCAAHTVKYNAFIKNQFEHVSTATSVNGSIDDARALADQAKLPHNSIRQRYELERKAGCALRSQLGSQDYFLLGEVYGGGNARTNAETLRQALCQKAASKGGDVVLIFREGVEQRQFAYTTPGHAQTNAYGSAYGVGNYAYGSATAYTTYTPGQTYAGTMYFPYGNGLVFRYVPGIEDLRKRTDALDDRQLEQLMGQVEKLWQDEHMTFKEALALWDQLLAGSPPR